MNSKKAKSVYKIIQNKLTFVSELRPTYPRKPHRLSEPLDWRNPSLKSEPLIERKPY